MDIPTFRSALVKPPEDPSSIHPALLNAIYCASCCLVGGLSFKCKDYFLRETFRQLHLSLQNVDRLTHFLWASVIIGSYLTNICRLAEAYVVISACARFAIACGLDGVTDINRSSTPQYPLLPPPSNEAEVKDRIQLSRAIYMADRALSMLSGFPSVYRTSPGIVRCSELSIVNLEGPPQYGEPDASNVSAASHTQIRSAPPQVFYQELLKILNGDTTLDLKSMQLYERVERLALQTKGSLHTFSCYLDTKGIHQY